MSNRKEVKKKPTKKKHLNIWIAYADEIEALCSIYGSEWKVEDAASRSYSMKILEGGYEVTMFIKLVAEYPSSKPPELQLLAPCLNGNQKQELLHELDDIYKQNPGEPVIYQWIEKIREYLQNLNPSEEVANVAESEETIEKITGNENREKLASKIKRGGTIQDRKSIFQAHVAEVHSEEEVNTIIDYLMENKKFADATHNILAYRIQNEKGNILQDFNDDGESQAGRRLLNLLQLSKVTNVMVVVSRWYGGIQLGPDRFRHINNAAREALEEGGFLQKSK